MSTLVVSNKPVTGEFDSTHIDSFSVSEKLYKRIILAYKQGRIEPDSFRQLLITAYRSLIPGGKLELTTFDPYDQPITEVDFPYEEHTVIPLKNDELLKYFFDCGFFIDRSEFTPTSRVAGFTLRKNVFNSRAFVRLKPYSLIRWMSCSVIAREVESKLLEKGIEVRFFPKDSQGIRPYEEVRRDNTYGDSIPHIDLIIDTPYALKELELLPARPGIWGYFFHEWVKGPKELADIMNRRLEKVFFVSNFCRNAFLEYLTIPSVVIHHGVDLNLFQPQLVEYKPFFQFVTVAAQQKRKGTMELISAFRQTFSIDDPVRLVIKDVNREINPNYPYHRLVQGDPRIQLIQESWDTVHVADLLKTSDCFVLPTYGEGFGIPILEAMACEIPVIVPRYSGHLDFCNDQNSFFLEKGVEVLRDDNYEYKEGAFKDTWLKPDLNELKNSLRYVYEHPEEAKIKAIKGRQTATGFSWENVLQPLIAALKEDIDARL